MLNKTMKRTTIMLAVLAMLATTSARAESLSPVPLAGAGLVPFAGFLTLGLVVAYLDATQTGPNDGPFNAVFPVVEQTYPDSGHHKGH
jgi:hypothetical protein